jgi:hypothetical protein
MPTSHIRMKWDLSLCNSSNYTQLDIEVTACVNTASFANQLKQTWNKKPYKLLLAKCKGATCHCTFRSLFLLTISSWGKECSSWQTKLHRVGYHLLSMWICHTWGDRGSTVVKILRYKSEGRWFDPRWCQFFHWHKSFWSHYGPGVDSASNINEYQEYFLGVNAAGAYGWQTYHHPVPLSRNLGTLTSWNLLGHSRPVTGLLYLIWDT